MILNLILLAMIAVMLALKKAGLFKFPSKWVERKGLNVEIRARTKWYRVDP